MILPFSGMNFAIAEEQTDPIRERILEKLSQDTTVYAQGAKSVHELSLVVYDLQNKVIEAKNNQDQEFVENNTDRLIKLQDELKSKFSGAEDMRELSQGIEPPKENGATIQNLDNRWATIGYKNVCGIYGEVAITGGFAVSHLSGVWMDGAITYPDELDMNYWPLCGGSAKILEFDEVVELYYPSTTPNQGCFHPFYNPVDYIDEYCPYIHNGDYVVVLTDGLYNHPTNQNWADFDLAMIGFMVVNFGGV